MAVDSVLSAWSRSGAAQLTGHSAGPPLDGPHAVARMVRDAVGRLEGAAAAWGGSVEFADPMALLGERAALHGLSRGGRVSCGGATRLLSTSDGWIAVALGRPEDRELLPAWLCDDGVPGPDDRAACFEWLAGVVARRASSDLVERAGILGLPVGWLGEELAPAPDGPSTARETSAVICTPITGAQDAMPARRPPLVMDLSALWAGPLCTSLLGLGSAEVVKVESFRRPDGMRADTTGFYDLLNAGKRSVAVDLSTDGGRATLLDLVRAADIVVESARPRALEQLGIRAIDLLQGGGPKVWVSITGHGRAGDRARRVAFGDDAAVAGGLVAVDADGLPVFLADAIADPLTALAAAAASAEAWAEGGRWLLDVAMSRVAASVSDASATPDVLTPSTELSDTVALMPRARAPRGPAATFGADTALVLDRLERR